MDLDSHFSSLLNRPLIEGLYLSYISFWSNLSSKKEHYFVISKITIVMLLFFLVETTNVYTHLHTGTPSLVFTLGHINSLFTFFQMTLATSTFSSARTRKKYHEEQSNEKSFLHSLGNYILKLAAFGETFWQNQ